jgi:hypothetical protein
MMSPGPLFRDKKRHARCCIDHCDSMGHQEQAVHSSQQRYQHRKQDRRERAKVSLVYNSSQLLEGYLQPMAG